MEGDIEIKGKTRTYVMNFGVNAMCRLESLAGGRSYQDVLDESNRTPPIITSTRMVIQAVLVDPAKVSAEEAGAILEDIGRLVVNVQDLVAQANGASEPAHEVAH